MIFKVSRNMFHLFQQVNACFSLVPSMFRNRPLEQEQNGNTFRNTLNMPLTSRNVRNTFLAGRRPSTTRKEAS